MKNKKLFAILTLVCFMFTLMPVAAFAAAPVTASATYGANGIYVEVSNVVAGDTVAADLVAGKTVLTSVERVMTKETITGNVTGATFYTNSAKVAASDWNQTEWVPMTNVVPTDINVTVTHADGKTETVVVRNLGGDRPDINETIWANGTIKNVVNVNSAGNIDDATSTFVAEDGDQAVKIGEDVVFELDVEDKIYAPAAGKVFIWAEETAGKASSALTIIAPTATEVMNNVWAINVVDYADVTVDFARAGEYTVYAAPAVEVGDDTNEVTELSKFDCDFSVITVKDGSVDPELAYKANGYAVDTEIASVNVVPNNVFSNKQVVTFTVDGQPMKGKTIAIETNSSSIEVNKASDKTDSQGRIDFEVAGSVEGKYEVILSVDGVEWTVEVVVGNTTATYINVAKAPKAPIALYEAIDDEVEFVITDINGNAVVNAANEGMEGIAGNATANTVDGRTYAKGSFVVLTEVPADSDIDSDDLGLKAELDANGNPTGVWVLTGLSSLDAEGAYAVKVILDNGAYATAEFAVKKFDKPVRLIIGTEVDTIELGAKLGGQLKYMDKNGVMKLAKDAELAADGYAVATAGGAGGYFSITAKSDEKYVGSVIKTTAVSEKYDLVATKEFKVAAGAAGIVVADANAEANVNNKITWNVVDENGNKVALKNANAGIVETDIKYVVLDKPEGAKVSVNDATILSDLEGKGEGKLALTSNKVGVVEVQVVLKAKYAATAGADNMQVKYYTGTAEIAVGLDNFEDVVVMSIGSKEIVINSDVKEMLCEAVIKDGRTFVPFRAGLEALGATVDYVDGQVIAEMDGVKVVMEAGKTAYTVNGVAKTADVAPYLNVEASTTMVPARFVADAFGINYDYTTNPDGTVADVIFAN